MEGVERGLRNRDIGAELGICTGTVKIHLKHIFEKTGIRGRYGLAPRARGVRAALRHRGAGPEARRGRRRHRVPDGDPDRGVNRASWVLIGVRVDTPSGPRRR